MLNHCSSKEFDEKWTENPTLSFYTKAVENAINKIEDDDSPYGRRYVDVDDSAFT